MSDGWIQFLQRWVVVTLGVLVAAHVVPGISYDTPGAVVIASLILGLLNALRPFLALLSLPIMFLTLGMFWFVINALLLWLVGYVVKGFHVAGFWPAFFGGLVISFVSLLINLVSGRGARIQVQTGRRPSRETQNSEGRSGSGKTLKGGKGPVIDI